MKKALGTCLSPLACLWIAVCLLLAGCGASKPIPDWLSSSHSQMESYQKYYLIGNDKLAVLRFQDALEEIKTSGDLEILARAYLIRMAMQTAALKDLDSAEFLKIDAVAPSLRNRSYYAFLKGETGQVDGKLLPEQYAGFIKVLDRDDKSGRLREIEAMKDASSQLIAIGVLVRKNQESEELLQKAVTIASAQGWKKALLAYLEKLKLYYAGKGDKAKVLEIEQRLELIKDKAEK